MLQCEQLCGYSTYLVQTFLKSTYNALKCRTSIFYDRMSYHIRATVWFFKSHLILPTSTNITNYCMAFLNIIWAYVLNSIVLEYAYLCITIVCHLQFFPASCKAAIIDPNFRRYKDSNYFSYSTFADEVVRILRCELVNVFIYL